MSIGGITKRKLNDNYQFEEQTIILSKTIKD
jgi:hypothetical protein